MSSEYVGALVCGPCTTAITNADWSAHDLKCNRECSDGGICDQLADMEMNAELLGNAIFGEPENIGVFDCFVCGEHYYGDAYQVTEIH